MKTPVVVDDIAFSLIKQYLAGLRGYNPMAEAVDLLMRTVQAACVSVSHAEAVLSSFDDQCPTPREIKEVALNLREHFLPPKPSQVEQWRKEYGSPDEAWSESMVKFATGNPTKAQAKAELNRLRTQSIKDAIAYEQEAVDVRGGKEGANLRAFWADHIRWLEKNFPEQVAAVRAGREPVFPEDRLHKAAKPLNAEGFEGPILKPISTESFEGVEPVPQKRCSTCGGSGRLAGDDYCDDCEIGRDLRRQEARYGGDTA